GHLAQDARLVGIYTGGAWVAERLHRALALATPLGVLAVTLHRDDFGRIGLHRESRRRPIPVPAAVREIRLHAADSGRTGVHRESRRSQIPFPVDGREIVLVDDVLHTGRTIRAALNELF